MKLRIKGNTIRLRIAVSEAEKLRAGDPLQEIVRFAPADGAFLAYALIPSDVTAPAVRYAAQEVSVLIPRATITQWAAGNDVGIYADIDIAPHGTLGVAIEKDFACLDLSDAENADTFANPAMGAKC